MLAQAREGPVDGDSAHPRRPGGIALELIQVQKGVQVRLLDDVLNLGGIAQDRTYHPVHALVVPPHQQLEGQVIAASRALDECLVRIVRL